MADFSEWSRLYECRQQVKADYPDIWSLPLVKKEMDRLLPNVREGCSVLEVGAGDRRFWKKIQAKRKNVVYRSMDIDRATQQDFYALDEIRGSYDLIFAFELIEHLTPEDGLTLVKALRAHLSPQGVLLLGTPNLYHPHRYFGDLTHKTPYKYEELGALLRLGGYAGLRFFRVYNDAWLRRLFRIYLGVWLHRYLDIDFAGTVLVEARAA
jgi:SAM-dependent methyltransferase